MVNRQQYLEILATERATANQLGAIHEQCARLGFGDDDRAERLAVCAELLGLDALASTGDLTQGQAGRLYRALLAFGTRAELDGARPGVRTGCATWWAARCHELPGMTDRAITGPVNRGGWPETYFTDVVCWLAGTLGIRPFHFPDSTRAKTRGWPDLMLLSPVGALARELKAHSDLRPDQRQTLSLLRANGVDADVWDLRDLISGRIARELWPIRKTDPR